MFGFLKRRRRPEALPDRIAGQQTDDFTPAERDYLARVSPAQFFAPQVRPEPQRRPSILDQFPPDPASMPGCRR